MRSLAKVCLLALVACGGTTAEARYDAGEDTGHERDARQDVTKPDARRVLDAGADAFQVEAAVDAELDAGADVFQVEAAVDAELDAGADVGDVDAYCRGFVDGGYPPAPTGTFAPVDGGAEAGAPCAGELCWFQCEAGPCMPDVRCASGSCLVLSLAHPNAIARGVCGGAP